MTAQDCRQCGAPPPTVQRYACALCGYPTPEAEKNGREPQPIKPEVRARLAQAVARRKGDVTFDQLANAPLDRPAEDTADGLPDRHFGSRWMR